jgi:hypothetical protein
MKGWVQRDMSLKLNDLKDYHDSREKAFTDKVKFPVKERAEKDWGV